MADLKPHVVWDLPLRLFHWLLAATVIAAVVTAKVGGGLMVWHGRLGLLAIGLVVFRVLWGFCGGATARFRQFWPTPKSLAAYLGGRWRGIGHNPLGALSVFALLLVVAVQASTGLMADDDIAYRGYLVARVAPEVVEWASQIHEAGQVALFGLVGLHLAAIAFYARVKGRNLVRPMLTGLDHSSVDVGEVPPVRASAWAALGCLVVALGVMATIVALSEAPATALPESHSPAGKNDW